MISRLRDFFTYERETAASLFVVRNIIEGENSFELPHQNMVAQARSFQEHESSTPMSALVEEDTKRILSIIAGAQNPLTSSEILSECLAHNVCSRATFFRKLKELVSEGHVKKVKKGKNCFYAVVD
ncbi:hypothetical protein COT72_00440 [archaeon CG10_big_fil_rev_8_21_14_0_10_43_11]|nr:MAG: hypothetical protein COT72_00440 [archaeon CG10_big_fil_rev_8_21_14_0_10_43_11]